MPKVARRSRWLNEMAMVEGEGEERGEEKVRQTPRRETARGAEWRRGGTSNDPLFPAKSLDDVIDNYEMIREA